MKLILSVLMITLLIGCGGSKDPVKKKDVTVEVVQQIDEVSQKAKPGITPGKTATFDNIDDTEVQEDSGIISCAGYKFIIQNPETGAILKCSNTYILPARLDACYNKRISKAQCGIFYGKKAACFYN